MKSARAKRKNRKVRQRSGSARRHPRLKIPPILLEGDEPALVGAAQPPTPYRFVAPPSIPQPLVESEPALQAEQPLAPPKVEAPSAESQPARTVAGLPEAAPEELPEAYGTKRLLLAARDPRWLYAHWDLTREQLQEYNNLSAQGHLVLRLYKEGEGRPNEIHVHPESRNWFIQVSEPGKRYRAELGYYSRDAKTWVCLSTSAPTATPPGGLSEDRSVQFKTLPADTPFNALVKLAQEAVTRNPALIELLERLRSHKDLPGPGGQTPGLSAAEQERALAQLLTLDESRRIWVSSFEITELVQRQFQKGAQGAQGAPGEEFEWPVAWSAVPPGISSPGFQQGEKPFWFNINAELIVYGATEPNAQVRIGGRPVQLRPDGSFSFRFALPDGSYALPAVAISAAQTESRAATLHFSRKTDYQGRVEAHPQAGELRPPPAENAA